MKNAVLIVLAIIIAAFLAVWCVGTVKSHRAADDEWPSNLGTLDEVPKRFPPTEQSAGATTLVRLASAANIDLRTRTREDSTRPSSSGKELALRKAVGEYITTQFERAGDAIDAPPPIVAEYLVANELSLNAVRDHLLSGAPIVWETKVSEGFNQPIPNLLGHMNLQKRLMARALDKARRNDPSAWDELHASWQLTRDLLKRPDLMSTLIAIASARMSNAAARKMPLPVPAWFSETLSYDYAKAMASAHQVDAWTIHATKSGHRSISDYLRAPLYAYQEADALNVFRDYAMQVINSKACDAGSETYTANVSFLPAGMALPNVLASWKRVLRLRAELEATERVLQLRAGQTPSEKSACSDGSWQVTPSSIKFSRDIKVTRPSLQVPLQYTR